MVKKVFYCIIFIMIIFAGIYAAKQISKKEETVKTTSTNTTNTANKIEEENKVEPTEENKTEENNTIVENNNPEEKAKQIVKQNWGEDDSVYYSYDGIDKSGRYIICVRAKDTTKALFWYYVDVESGTFDIE